MQDLRVREIGDFAQVLKELYRVFFKKYPIFKPMLINAILYGNGNYGLIVTENKKVIGKYTIFQSSQGFLVDSNIRDGINLKFVLESKVIIDILSNRDVFAAKPYKLMRYLFMLLSSMTVVEKGSQTNLITGEKVILRPYDDSDMPYLLEWYNDYELNKLAGWSSGRVSASKLKYNMSRSFGSDPMNLMIDNLNGKPIGTIQLYDIDEQDKSCKLGIRIGDRDYWSQGYGTDSVNILVEYAFMKMGLYRVALRVYEFNGRAARCYEKCGFKYEGRSRKSAYIDGDYYDEILMGILKSEFLKGD
ncbi:MAG: GCN5-related N-acetyltransferase [Clostridia bacterium]|jgi:RimJ/RimL family protein N-acetyltransferase|nr:GCN5-related N-acetyltransferase [Clostridia bacterium]